MNDIIRIAIVDDHILFRNAVSSILKNDERFEVVGEGATAEEAVNLARDLHPEILLLDISMPGGGLNSAQKVVICYPETRVVILTSSQRDEDLHTAARIGVCAYVYKGISARDLINILYEVHIGHCSIPQ